MYPNNPRNINTFISCDSEYNDSNIVLFGAPFDSTTSYRPGSRFASAAIRNESYGIETYSPYIDKDLSDLSIYDGGDLELPFGNPLNALKMIESYADMVYDDKKIPFMLGGEHLVTYGAVRSAVKHYRNLHIIHFDAHTDLRDQYLGEMLSHASVMRRCWELLGNGKIFQFGIRSGERDEFIFAQEHLFIQKFNFDGIQDVVSQLRDYPVYFTIDLDVLDPSEFPGTGTPESGGVRFLELLNAASEVLTLNVVGMDITELSPPIDTSGSSTALACKLLRELLLRL